MSIIGMAGILKTIGQAAREPVDVGAAEGGDRNFLGGRIDGDGLKGGFLGKGFDNRTRKTTGRGVMFPRLRRLARVVRRLAHAIYL